MREFIVLPVLALLFFAGSSHAQHRGPQERGMLERFKSEKISYITEQLDLSPEEAQQFWPLYNAYEKKRMELNIERRKLERHYKESAETIKEKEVIGMLDDMHAIALKEVKLNKAYNDQFLKVLSPKKVLALHHIEKRFRTRMLKKFRERGGSPGKQFN